MQNYQKNLHGRYLNVEKMSHIWYKQKVRSSKDGPVKKILCILYKQFVHKAQCTNYW